ncbi:hypothetical protein HMY34_17285 [Thiothrix subterranea]|uniref:hypothetical protein n=1 Tax=Thiothrix subterranea TaxID=2735563 RepID=UPI00192C5D4D|nr:hypothetical protein [Thiothrix subterranea]QQZ30366.1 hypothetical protein HMY34_17285 [Thiothrix subterranea]
MDKKDNTDRHAFEEKVHIKIKAKFSNTCSKEIIFKIFCRHFLSVPLSSRYDR